MARPEELHNSTLVWVKTDKMARGRLGIVLNDRDGGFINVRLQEGSMTHLPIDQIFDPRDLTVIPQFCTSVVPEPPPQRLIRTAYSHLLDDD